jgi:hypothetical protein
MAGATQRGIRHRVPPVDPELLAETIAIVYGWADADLEDDDCEAVAEQQLFDLLSRITQRLDVETSTAVALFKRSLVLFSYCAETDLCQAFFRDGFPGRELCTAASRAAVHHAVVTARGPVTPSFDIDDLNAAFRAALN